MRPYIALVAFAVVACSGSPKPQAVNLTPSQAASSKLPPSAPHKLNFVEDDVPGARSDAIRTGKLLVVDVWAPWCHVCLSMRSFVLGSPSLGELDEIAVFASMDFDKPESAPFLEQYHVHELPTLLVIDPTNGEVIGARLGSASASELGQLIQESSKLRRGVRSETADYWISQAYRFRVNHTPAEVADSFDHAIKVAPAGWNRWGEAVIGLLDSLEKARRYGECLRVGREYAKGLPGSSAPADAAFYILQCAEHATGEEQKAARALAMGILQEFVEHPPQGASVDDRGDASSTLADLIEAGGEGDRARAVREAWSAMIERAAKEASSVEDAHVFDYQRANVLTALGRPEEAMTMLMEREKQLPQSYEPPSRLARVFVKMGRLQEARQAAERAIGRSYGPRRLSYLKLRAEIEGKMGDRGAEVATIREEVKGWEAMPVGQANAERVSDAKRRLEEAEKRK